VVDTKCDVPIVFLKDVLTDSSLRNLAFFSAVRRLSGRRSFTGDLVRSWASVHIAIGIVVIGSTGERYRRKKRETLASFYLPIASAVVAVRLSIMSSSTLSTRRHKPAGPTGEGFADFLQHQEKAILDKQLDLPASKTSFFTVRFITVVYRSIIDMSIALSTCYGLGQSNSICRRGMFHCSRNG
jgi:hypothetical protein